jgi:hypothetical protein
MSHPSQCRRFGLGDERLDGFDALGKETTLAWRRQYYRPIDSIIGPLAQYIIMLIVLL